MGWENFSQAKSRGGFAGVEEEEGLFRASRVGRGLDDGDCLRTLSQPERMSGSVCWHGCADDDGGRNDGMGRGAEEEDVVGC